MFETNLNNVPTAELWERIQTINEKSMMAPPHLRAQLYQQYLQLSQEYGQRTDK
jgi:hypothetical protein